MIFQYFNLSHICKAEYLRTYNILCMKIDIYYIMCYYTAIVNFMRTHRGSFGFV